MAETQDYLAKAQESLAGAESELAYRRFNSCARGAYFACFQAAIAALLDAGLSPPNLAGRWGHDRVQASFADQLIRRRQRYPATLRRTLTELIGIRQKADYRPISVSQREATRVVRQAQEFVREVATRLSS